MIAPLNGNFTRDAEGVLVSRGPAGLDFSYSDGLEVERHLSRILEGARDLRAGSEELESHITDFVSRCHLSSCRTHLLRPLATLLNGGRILEVGSGCGPLTRYLGETGAEVWSVEGSLVRARMCASRCRDLGNVRVVCGNISDLQFDSGFDSVLLVGVLEYASRFLDGADGPQRMLRQCAGALSSGGVLVLAIENQLGLKYWAGAPEDHLGIPYAGLNDAYGRSGVRTFGRLELQQLLHGAGLPFCEFLYPFPDYKFPSAVLTERAFSHAEFSAGDLIRNFTAENYGIPFTTAFSEQMAWPVVARNGLAAQLANSFLVVAAARPENLRMERETLAWLYSGFRRRPFAKETQVAATEDGDVHVRRRHLYREPADANATYVQRIHDSPWRPGVVWRDRLIAIVNLPWWSLEDVAAWAAPWVRFVEANISHAEPIALVPGDLVDCTPANVIRRNDGEMEFFDRELVSIHPIPLTYVLMRGIYLSLAQLRSVAHSSHAPVKLIDLTTGILKLCGVPVAAAEVDDFIRRECEFQRDIAGPAATSEDRLRSGELPEAREEALPAPGLRRLLRATERQVQEMIVSSATEVAKRDATVEYFKAREQALTREVENLRLALANGRFGPGVLD